jgi:hypothetical protein
MYSPITQIRTKAECVHTLKGLALPRACHSGEIALASSRRLHSTLKEAPVLFAHGVVTADKTGRLPTPHWKTASGPPDFSTPLKLGNNTSFLKLLQDVSQQATRGLLKVLGHGALACVATINAREAANSQTLAQVNLADQRCCNEQRENK